MSLQSTINSALMSDSDDERYKQELEKRRQEVEAKLQKERQRQKEVDDAFHQEVDRQAAVVQVWQKNWLKKANPEPLASPLSEKEINLIDFLSLTKRQWVCYFPKETLEQC